ncbi:MAG: hypothetical protein IT374_16435 [Polyangiaceae bacterium]|nr:hypothetical protein [Polyangiaceae bacterium]
MPPVLRTSLVALALLTPSVSVAEEARGPLEFAPRTRPNTPPKLGDKGTRHERLPTRPEEPLVFSLYASDPDGDALRFTVTGLPPGATLEQPRSGESNAIVTWPSPSGGALTLGVEVSDGKSSDTATLRIVFEEEWESGFLPGLGYTGYAPASGAYAQGPRVEIVFFSWIHRNDNRGPSHGRISLDLDLMFPKEGKSVFAPALALDLSFERNPQRRFLIPTFGLATGALLPTGRTGAATLTPTLGLHLYASPNVFVHAEGGYLLPLRTSVFDDYRGARGGLVVDFTMW